jgi:hypothetical protein
MIEQLPAMIGQGGVPRMTRPDAHTQERAASKRRAVAALRYAWSTIQQQQREPDPWQRACFKRGPDLLVAGAYDAVQPEVESALLSPAQRSIGAQPLSDPSLDRLNLITMKQELTAAARKPVIPTR